MKYLSHEEYLKAKEGSAPYMHLDELLPIPTRKIFPFYHHVILSLHDKYLKRKEEHPLSCAHCKSDLSEGGNGSYYTGYIVFDNAQSFYSCCYDCRPESALDWVDQQYGFPEPMKIMKEGKVFDWVSSDHLHVFYRFIKDRYNLWLFPNGFKSIAEARKELHASSYWCSSNSNGWIDTRHLKIIIQDKNFNVIHTISEKETLKLINDIIRHNVAGNYQPERIFPPPGTQLSLF